MIEHIPPSLQGINQKELKQILIDYLDQYVSKRMSEWNSYWGQTKSFVQSKVTGESNEEIIRKCINKIKNSIQITDSFEHWLDLANELRDDATLTQNAKDKFFFTDGSPALSAETFHALANIIICVLESADEYTEQFEKKIKYELNEIQLNTLLLAKNNLGSGKGADGYRDLIEKHQINLANLGYIPALNWLIDHKVPTFFNSPRGEEALKKYNCLGNANCDLPIFYQTFFGEHYFNSSLTSTKFPEFNALVWEGKRKASMKKEEGSTYVKLFSHEGFGSIAMVPPGNPHIVENNVENQEALKPLSKISPESFQTVAQETPAVKRRR